MHYVITAHVPDLRIGEQSESLLAVETFEVDTEVVGVVESSELSVRAEMKTLHFLMLFLCLLFPSNSAADESNGNYTDICNGMHCMI